MPNQVVNNEPSAMTTSVSTTQLETWLAKRFTNEGTKKGYRVALLHWLTAIYGEQEYPKRHPPARVALGIEKYLNEKRNFLEDFNNYLLWQNKHHTPRSIVSRAFSVRKFFDRHEHEISKNDWDDLTSLFPANVSVTQDEIPEKEQLKSIVSHLYIEHRAIALFLLSSGARIGETLQLRTGDLDLDADVPSVKFRAEYTKGGVGRRTTWMSFEARDVITEWLKVKDSINKRGLKGKKVYDKDMIFPIEYLSFAKGWASALEKSGLNKMDARVHTYVYHVHTLRKFFSTNMSVAGVPRDIYEAWMGHKEYLDASYKRYNLKQLAEIYLKNMAVVSLYGDRSNAGFAKKLEAIEQQNKEKDAQLKQQNEELNNVDLMLDKLGIPNHRPREERLLEYFRITQERQKQPISQPIKSEPVISIQVTEEPIVVEAHEQARPQTLNETEWIWCPSQIWVKKETCEQQCRINLSNQYSPCQAERLRNPNSFLFKPKAPKPQ